ncbi:MAG TPA: methyltransferase domain-containing protein [Pirellulales bacterium]|nr:methyltransferase domain-containing protein [Pirellulales bacterium]
MTDGRDFSSPPGGTTPYDDAFFDRLQQGALRSAAVVVPHLMRWISPQSVVDIGCGRGAWLSVFQQHGVETLLGVDGPYVERERLAIPQECFREANLDGPLSLEGSFDLALCLEVAEHLNWRHGPGLVTKLASLAPFVLFSAAVPGQSGVHHVNAQWPWYWVNLFRERGFQCLDVVRPKIWRDTGVDFFYRQNTFLFASSAGLERRPHLLEEEAFSFDDLQLIHAGILGQFQGVRGLLAHLPGALRRAITNRLTLKGRHWGSPFP